MEPLRYSDILRATQGEPTGSVRGDPWIPAVTTDSRKIEPGALFVPIRGKSLDAHEFIGQAFLSGAGFSLAGRHGIFPTVPILTHLVRRHPRALAPLHRAMTRLLPVPGWCFLNIVRFARP